MKNGLFITFEGVDGCGKSTQLELVAEFLSKNYEVIKTKEPGAKGLCEKLREILLNYDGEIAPRCESFLFLADRAQHISQIVTPAVKSGKIVLCDRHTDSTVAYQGYGRNINLDEINFLNNLATEGMKPNLTLVFDVDIKTSMERVGKNKDRMESGGIEFFERVRNGYLEIAKQDSKRVKLIDSTKSIDEVFKEVLSYITPLL